MHILIVEDTHDIGNAMKQYLEACDYTVTWVTTLKDCYVALKSKHIDCVVLDRMLPDGEWIQAVHEIKAYKNIPIIMETAKSQIENKVEGFTSGADDYLTKPFDLQELELRIKSITKRNEPGDVMYWKDVTIDLEKKQIFRNDKLVHVTNKEFVIIGLLLLNNGNVISRSDLMEEVRGEDGVRGKDNKLDVYISTIRRKLGKDFIQTEKWFGYRISM